MRILRREFNERSDNLNLLILSELVSRDLVRGSEGEKGNRVVRLPVKSETRSEVTERPQEERERKEIEIT